MKLTIKTQKNNVPKINEEINKCVIFLNDKQETYISVNAYGDDDEDRYKEREIRIVGEENKLLFVGTFTELERKLKMV
jgi:hypothetical protein